MEGFEELCRMGVWDHVVSMSGADLNLRAVEDLAFALAPYRGNYYSHCIISNITSLEIMRKLMRNSKLFLGDSLISLFGSEPRNSDLTPETQRLCLDGFASCGGFTYNVTRMHGQPTAEELPIMGGSQWATLSRQLVEDLMDQEKHTQQWRK